MSSTVDNRIVDMQFNNDEFERDVKTTMSTLDKLKKRLDFKGATDGLDTLNTSVKKINFSGMAAGIESVQQHFSAMSVIGMTALFNLTNAAINAGKRIANSLTIDPIKTGFQEYETQINAIQTILANTSTKGSTLTQVNQALEELNKYADMTIYNFTEMTRNIGTFTAAGVDLDTSVSAIKGIANLAAVSGSNAQQASTAMYQLSQALASGTVKLMDWNSVVNAGMGGQIFQDALKETARIHGVAIDKMIKNEGSFRETLSDGWLTAEILTETLAKFTGDLSAEQLKQQGYTEKQIVEIMKLGDMANKAATEVKTVTQLMDTLKEAAQSGWTQSWQIMVGDFKEAKTLLTEVSDVIGGMLGKSADARNKTLTEGLSTGWKQLLSQGIPNEDAYINSIKTVAKEHGIVVDDLIAKSGSFEKSLESGWLSSNILAKSLTNLTEKTKGLSDEELEKLGYTRQQITAMEELNTKVQNGSVNMKNYADKMKMLSGRENIIIGIRNSFSLLLDILKPVNTAFRDIFPATTGDQLYAITKRIKEFSQDFSMGKDTAENIKNTFGGLFAVLDIGRMTVVNMAGALGLLFTHLSPIGFSILHVTGNIGKLLMSLRESVQNITGLSDGFEKLKNKLQPVVSSIVDMLEALAESLNIMNGFDMSGARDTGEALKTILSPITAILRLFGDAILAISPLLTDAFESIGHVISVFAKKISDEMQNMDFQTIISLLNGVLFAGILKAVKDFVKGLDDITGSGKSIVGNIKGILDGVGDSLEAYQKNLQSKTLITIATAIAILAGSLVAISLIDSKKLSTSLETLSILFAEMFVASGVFGKLLGATQLFSAVKTIIIIQGLAMAILILAKALDEIAVLDWQQLTKGVIAIGAMSAILAVTSKFLGKDVGKITATAVGLIAFATAMRILVESVKSLGAMDIPSLVKGLGSLGILLAELGLFMSLTNFGKMNVGSSVSLIGLGVALNILAVAVKKFGDLEPKQIVNGLITMSGVLVALGVFINTMGNPARMISTAVGITILGGAMIVFGEAIKNMGSSSVEVLAKGLITMSLALLAIAGAMHLMPKDMLISAAALTIVSGSLVLLTSVLNTLGSMSPAEIAKSLITLGVSLGILAGAMTLMAAGLPGVVAMSAMSVALAIFVPSLLIMSSIPLIGIITGLVGLAGAFTIMGVAGLVLGPMAPVLVTLAAALALLGVGFVTIGGGTMLFATGIALLANNLALFVQELGKALMGMTDMIPALFKMVSESIKAFADIIGEAAPSVIKSIVILLDAIIQAVGISIPKIVDLFVKLMIDIFTAIKNATPQLIALGMDIVIGLISGIAEKMDDLVAAAIDLMLSFINGITSKIPDLIQAGFDMVIAFINGVANSIRDNTEALTSAMMNLAGSMIEGMVLGLFNGVKEVGEAAMNLGKSALDAVAKFLDINSPSRKFKKLGMFSVEGFVIGFKTLKAYLKKNVINVFDTSVYQPVREYVKKTSDLMSYGGGSLSYFVSEYVGLNKALGDTSSIDKAADAIQKYGVKLYEESEQYKTDTKNAKEHKDELTKLEAEYKKLETQLNNTSVSKKKATEIKNEMKKLQTSIKSTKEKIIQDEKDIIQHTNDAFTNLHTSISNTVKASMDPLKQSLDSQVKLFEAFDEGAELAVGDVLANMQGQIDGVKKWNADLDALAYKGFAVGLIDQLKNMGPSGANYIKAFMTMTTDEMDLANAAFKESSAMSSQTLIDNFKTSIDEAKKWSEDMATLVKTGLNQDIIESLGDMGPEGGEYIKAFMTMTPDQITEFNKQYEDYLKLPSSISDKVIASFVAAGQTASAKFAESLKTGTSPETEDGEKVGENSTSLGEDMVNGVIGALNEARPGMTSLSGVIGEDVYLAMEKNVSKPKGDELGSSMCTGLINGLRNYANAVKDAARQVAKDAYDAAKAELDINSPSRKFASLGMFTVKGFVNGLSSMLNDVKRGGQRIGQTALNATKTVASKIADVLDPNFTPTIRPVMDLTDVLNGKRSIDSILDSTGGVTLYSGNDNIRTTANRMTKTPAAIQNGSTGSTNVTNKYEQNIYSPKPLSRIELYRQSKNLFAAQKGRVED